MAEISSREEVTWAISDFSNSGNPICRNKSWDRDVVVLVDDDTELEQGETIDFVIMRTKGDHYRALLKDGSLISKPDYASGTSIPLHHDGKHGESVGDTRSESHASRSIDDRD